MAASRTVTLNVIGNSTGAQQALKQVGDHAEQSSKRMGAAFSGVLGTLNSTGVLGPFGEALNKITESVDGLGEHGKAAGAKLMGIGAAGIGLGGLFTAIGDKDKAASQQLKASVEAIGGSYDDMKEKFEGVIKANEKYGDDAKKTQDALAILTTGLGSAEKATDSMSTVLNLAAKRHEDLTQAATDWVKINEGKGAKILATLGIAHTDNAKAVAKEEAAQKAATAADDKAAAAKQKLADLIDIQHSKATLTESDHIALRNAQQAVTDASAKAAEADQNLYNAQVGASIGASKLTDAQEVAKRVTGQADAQASTFTGHLKALTTHFEDQAASLGQKYGPALMTVSGAVTGLGAGVELASGILGKFKNAQEAAAVATDGLAASETAEGAASTLALGPILAIVAGVAAVGVALYELWKHWSTIWGWIKDAASSAWQWIQKHMLLIGALFGPLGLIIAELGQHWKAVWDGVQSAVQAVWDVIRPILDKIGGAIKDVAGPLGAVLGAAGKVGGAIGGALSHIPGLASGGTAYGNRPYVVGEEGPELFIPGATGAVVSNGAFGGVSIAAINVYPPPGLDERAVAANVRDEVLRTIRRNINGGLA